MEIIILILPLILVGVVMYLLNIEKQKMNDDKLYKKDIESSSEKNNPAFHLFLYLVSFISVGFLVAGIIISFFQAINKFVPDDFLDRDSSYFDNDIMRFGLSALIVTIPLYYGILYLLNKKLKRDEIPADSLVRKTITYLALVAFFGMTLGSLVGLVYNYFDGELTARFVFKTFIFLLTSLFFFGFYFWEIRRSTFSSRLFLRFFIASMVLAIVSLVLGLFVIDSPSLTRIKKTDKELIRRMENAGRSVNGKYRNEDSTGTKNMSQKERKDLVITEMAKNGKGPKEIEEFIDKFYSGEEVDSLPTISQMQGLIDEDIIYNPVKDGRYELCGTFRGSDSGNNDRWQTDRKKWAHPAGYHCFVFDAGIQSGYSVYPVQMKVE